MKILIVGLKKQYQYVRLKEEAEVRGHTISSCKSLDLAIFSDVSHFDLRIKDIAIHEYDLIYSFAAKRIWEWHTLFRHLYLTQGTIIVNRKIADTDNIFTLFQTPLSEYYMQYKEKLPFPKSLVVYSDDAIGKQLEEFEYPLIVKNGLIHRGKQVYKVENKSELLETIGKIRDLRSPIVIREFIPNDGDLRIVVINGHAIGAMKRIPKKGEFRSNISIGGRGEVFDLNANPHIRELAEKAASEFQVDIAGVDIIVHKETGDPYILEVNICPQIEGFETYTKINAAGKIIEYFEHLYAHKSQN